MRGYRNPHPGDLREQIDILRETNTINANGYPVPSYEVVHKKLWAGADDAGNQAFRASDSEIAQNVINFVVRHRSDIEVGMFVRYQGELRAIVDIGHYGFRRRYLGLKTMKNKAVTE